MERDKIEIRGARVHNLKNIDIDIPLNRIVGVAGVSGSGKSSLALGVVYAEGSRRYLEALSTYTRRRISQAPKAEVDDILYVPAAIALRQRPGVPGIRSTFGTGTELLNSLRLMFSRLASHRCPNGHYCKPTLNVAAGKEIVCPTCGAHFFAPSAEELSFNSGGACKKCGGIGTIMTVDESTLIPDQNLTIDQGAVAPWNSLMWTLMIDVCRAMGVRTDVPFKDLTPEEKEVVYHGPAVKKHILYKSKTSAVGGEMDFTYYNATYTVENALAKVKDDKGMKRVEKFLKQDTCPECHGTRFSDAALAPLIRGINLAQACEMPLSQLDEWVKSIPAWLPEDMRPMCESICRSYFDTSRRLLELGLSYLSLDRAGSTLSTGERQRMQLARCVRNRTTGVIYVLDEPSIGLHPANIVGLVGVMKDLTDDGNSVLLVDHDTQILQNADHMIELGPQAGAKGGEIIAQGTIDQITHNPESMIGSFLASDKAQIVRQRTAAADMFSVGVIEMHTRQIHTVHPLDVKIPKGRMTAITGVSGSGKTTTILESLVPALQAMLHGKELPGHIKSISAGSIKNVKLIDSTPIGANVRSTVATYANVHDDLRKMFAKTPAAKGASVKAGDFSYNTGTLRCPVCDGTGTVSLDVQFLPDVDIPCPECHGSRYAQKCEEFRYEATDGHSYSMPDLMKMDVADAEKALSRYNTLRSRLESLNRIGLGYITLGEATTSLSGGEAQRLKLAAEMGIRQDDSIFIFDEPTIGLHPLDTQTLIKVFQQLLDLGATIIIIEHDLDIIANSDYVIDLGPGGGEEGGKIVAQGTPEEIAATPASITGRFLNL